MIFANTETAKNAFYKIANISDENNKKIFGDIQQIDNKLFVSFVYDIEIKDQKVQHYDIKILDFVNFVALKNGMHSSQGFIYTSFNSKFLDVVNITKVKEMIFNFFNKKIMQISNLKICVIGLGYVGLPLAVELAKKFDVTAFDINKSRIKKLKSNIDVNNEISSSKLRSIRDKINYTDNSFSLGKNNFYIITVPTPINSQKNQI